MASYADQSTPVNVNLGTGQNGNTINIVIGRPGISNSGNVMFAQLYIPHDTDTSLPGFTMPSGWTQRVAAYANTAGYWWIICSKTDGGSEPTTYTFSYTADTRYVYSDGIIHEYSATNGTVESAAAGTESTGTDKVAPSANSTYDNSLMIVYAMEDNFSNSTCTGFTERFDNSAYGPKAYDKALSASGATGTATVVSGAGNGYAATIILQDTTPTGGGGPEEVGLAGAQPASTGTLAKRYNKTLAGAQPAATGDITAKQYKALAGAQPAASGTLAVQYRKALAGAQPAASGTLAVQYRIALAGAQPAPSGTIAAQQTLARSLAGDQPAASGALTVNSGVNLAGAQPAATGTIAAQQDLARSLAGDQPSATGTIAAQQTLARSLAGDQPAASGDISALQYKALAGAQPAATGTIDAQTGTTLVNLAGAQPASTGTLAAASTLARTLSGAQPAPSGALALRYILVHIALVGIQPASTGTLAPFSTLARSLAGAQPAGSGTIAVVTGITTGWVEITVTISPALVLSVSAQRALELGVTTQPALELYPVING